MKRNAKVILASVLAAAAVGVLVVYNNIPKTVEVVTLGVNYADTRNMPAGTLEAEQAPDWTAAALASVNGSASTAAVASTDWPSYNKTLTSERYSDLAQIDTHNVGGLRVRCTYDTHQHVSFQTGLLMVQGALIGTTSHDIFSISPVDCRENWRVHEDYEPGSLTGVNRGAAYLDGMLFRGTQDGRVLAYDLKTGRRQWATPIANPKLSETAPSAPIAWNGMVFIGSAGGDSKGVRGRMYGLDAKTGAVRWEFFLLPKAAEDPTRGPRAASPDVSDTWKNPPGVPISGGGTWTSYTLDPASGRLYVPVGNPAPDLNIHLREGDNLYSDSVLVLDARTGAYIHHYKIMPRDWHDWDVSGTPALIHTRGGKTLLTLAPKDGFLYGIDLSNDKLLYRAANNRIENADVPLTVEKPVHFCPGTAGGAEWNGPAYDPRTNLTLVGQVDWCYTAQLTEDKKTMAVATGLPWFGADFVNPYHFMGSPDAPFTHWGGWLYATDADTGTWKWRVRSNYPVVGGVTPTAGGLVLFGDEGGNFYALDSTTGKRLWGKKIGGAIGGGVITYSIDGRQLIAVATGFESVLWPTEVATGQVAILGLE